MHKLPSLLVIGATLALSAFAVSASPTPTADWAITISMSPSSVQVGGSTTWSGVVTNNGVTVAGQAVELLGYIGPGCGGSNYGGSTLVTDGSGAYADSGHIALSPGLYSFDASVLDNNVNRNVLARSGCVNLTVTIVRPDIVPPTLTVPGHLTIEATGPSGAGVTYTASATDDLDPNPTVACSPPSGSVFQLGVTTVSCTGTDASGNRASGTFTVTVADRTPPVLTLPAGKVVDATGPNGATVPYTATATDTVNPSPTLTCSPPSGSRFAIGTTTVNCTATDEAGNKTSGSFTVEVVRVKPLIGAPTTTPAKAIAGKRLTVTFKVTRSDNGTPLASGRMTCDASIQGRVIQHAEQFTSGVARLAFTIPKNAKGKLLKVRLTINLAGQSATKIATFHVK